MSTSKEKHYRELGKLSSREYNDRFEELMHYTSFGSADNILGDSKEETMQNLTKAFKELETNYSGRGAVNTSGKFKDEFTSTMWKRFTGLFKSENKKAEQQITLTQPMISIPQKQKGIRVIRKASIKRSYYQAIVFEREKLTRQKQYRPYKREINYTFSEMLKALRRHQQKIKKR